MACIPSRKRENQHGKLENHIFNRKITEQLVVFWYQVMFVFKGPRSHPLKETPGSFTNSYSGLFFFLCGETCGRKKRYLPRVCGRNHWRGTSCSSAILNPSDQWCPATCATQFSTPLPYLSRQRSPEVRFLGGWFHMLIPKMDKHHVFLLKKTQLYSWWFFTNPLWKNMATVKLDSRDPQGILG